MDKNTMYIVKNRSASSVCYRIPEMGIRREFAIGETKKISFEELEKLTYQPGGRALMANFLQIDNDAAIEELNIPVEPEYYMTEAQIVELLRSGSLDQFLDCLDFAPVGVIDLVKQFAVSLPLENTEKKEALKQKTGFDVEKALANLKAEKEASEEEKAPAVRRVKEESAQPTGRRTSGETYKIIKKSE